MKPHEIGPRRGRTTVSGRGQESECGTGSGARVGEWGPCRHRARIEAFRRGLRERSPSERDGGGPSSRGQAHVLINSAPLGPHLLVFVKLGAGQGFHDLQTIDVRREQPDVQARTIHALRKLFCTLLTILLALECALGRGIPLEVVDDASCPLYYLREPRLCAREVSAHPICKLKRTP